MIIIKKKRILFMISLIMVSVFSFSLQKKSNEEIVPTVSLPVSNKVIVIDARTWSTR